MQLRDNYKYTYITAQTTTQVVTGQGCLVRIVINASSGGTIKVIDNTAGTTANIATIKANTAEQSLEYGIQFVSGLRIVTGSTADITVVTSQLPS